MDLGGGVSGRKACNVSDLLGGCSLQVEKDDLPVERSETVNQCLKLGQFFAASFLSLPSLRGGVSGEGFEFHESFCRLAAFGEVICADVVGYPVNPRPQAAAVIKPLQTAPQFDVHLLEEIALLVCVGFIPTDQTAH